MFYWPHCELTEYEKKFVSLYSVPGDPKTGAGFKPGVLRRTYKVLFNNTVHANIPGFESIHNSGAVQISRRSRVFGLTFAGDANLWRLNISTASGEQFTPRSPGNPNPLVSSMVPGTSWHALAAAMNGPAGANQVAFNALPLIIEPNWEMVPNESLVFEGTPVTETAIVLEIAVHVWEFPGMVLGAKTPGDGPPRAGAGPSIGKRC